MIASSAKLDKVFGALAEPTRRAILARLSRGDVSVCELAEPFDVSLPAISKHLRVLERAGLLTQDKQGRVRRCHLEAAPMKAAADWIERYRIFWTRQLDSLARYLEETAAPSQEKQPCRRKKLPRRKS
jgi:DNA-binding transcriptional ArsR family regulator